ncbi:hypothetical protein EQM13_06430 [Acidilutibacter cellobiosedens]|uniref:Uncharacterized protein n=1 Tax=Acidilutibacter cellobiosedens TaxID=2507161 RepID=A0A410QBB8_9FIRM|nr:hypothetical protein [Acidilutibacter cellobiosedens]QAT61250.1 hypothetical protein EQM13_06430 [Acidilutibacter cellobiosedens]
MDNRRKSNTHSEKFVKETNDSFSLGETMDIFGKKYKIVGIYENDKYSKSKIENLYVKKEDIPENLGEGEKHFTVLKSNLKMKTEKTL